MTWSSYENDCCFLVFINILQSRWNRIWNFMSLNKIRKFDLCLVLFRLLVRMEIFVGTVNQYALAEVHVYCPWSPSRKWSERDTFLSACVWMHSFALPWQCQASWQVRVVQWWHQPFHFTENFIARFIGGFPNCKQFGHSS